MDTFSSSYRIFSWGNSKISSFQYFRKSVFWWNYIPSEHLQEIQFSAKMQAVSPETSLKLIHSTRVFTVFTHILFIQIFPTKRFWKFCALSEQLSRSQPWTTCIFTNQKNKTKQNKTNKKVTLTYSEPYLETVARIFH